MASRARPVVSSAITSRAAASRATSSPVQRLFAVLELAADRGTIGTADITDTLELPRPTAHRMIATLEGLGLLQKMPTRGQYAVAHRLVGLATSVLRSSIVYAPMQSLLATVAQRAGETCGVALMSNGEVEYIASVMGLSSLTLQFQAGQKAPLHCTSSGQVFLAALDDQSLERFLASGPWEAMTPSTVTEPKALMSRLRRVRALGYATNDSEYIAGVVGAAVPVRHADGSVIATLNISAPRSRRTLDEIRALVPTLNTYASRLARLL